MIKGLGPKAAGGASVFVLGLAALQLFGAASGRTGGPSPERPELVRLPSGSITYPMAGEFSQAGRTVNSPAIKFQLERPLDVMRYQVSVADYEKCVAGHACEKLAASVSRGAGLPAVQVSWRDATAYAAWLSARTGEVWRLPTDEEWAYAAGSRFRDYGLPQGNDPSDPSKRWLAKYDREAEGETPSSSGPIRPLGGFGANERGLFDLSGNVWEWTNTCFVRQSLDKGDRRLAGPVVNCGVRVVEGGHRTYIPDFIRDARGGGCATGTPPSNLGFRLVRERNLVNEVAGERGAARTGG